MNRVTLARIAKYLAVSLQVCGLGVFSAEAILADDPDLTRPYRSVREVVYREIGGDKLSADIFRPVHKATCPAVLMIHGGGWSSGDKWNVHDHARELAQAGFVAIAINYRLAPLHRIGDQIDDCRTALKWVESSANKFQVDPKRIALWGYSAGAHLACMLATQPAADAPAVRALIAGGAPCDFENIPEDSRVLSMVMGGTRKQLPQVYVNVSPLNFASAACPPSLFFHGSTDVIVPSASSRRMHAALLASGAESEYLVVEGKGHLTTFLDGAARRHTIDFLSKHLTSDH